MANSLQAKIPVAKAVSQQPDSLFLPDFCSIQLIFGVVILGEFMAILFVLAGGMSDIWNRLGLMSLFVQWIILSCAALLCLLRPMLSRYSNTAAILISYLLLLTVAILISEFAFRTLGASVERSHSEFLLTNFIISAIISALVLRYLFISHQWKLQIHAEAQARIQALQARIRPHFLFNSMNSIAALTRSDPVRAEQAVEDLSELFRGSLRESNDRVTLADEIDTAQRYLSMEALRLGERLQVDWDIATLPKQRKVPSLILQPLLENAVYYGIENLPNGGIIRIHGYVENKTIRIAVSNPKPGKLNQNQNRKQGHHIAMDNIRLRLQLAFGPKTGLSLQENSDQVTVTLFFPRENAT
ncbi:MAG: histidine kinase [Gammaproteobacteria bacterium]